MNKKKRQEVLERDNNKCQFCEMNNQEHEKEYGRGIEVHHIIPKKVEGSDKKENLLTVCCSCHATLERTQGDALKRIQDRYKAERYSTEEIFEAVKQVSSKTTAYFVKKPILGSDRDRTIRVTTKREHALSSLENIENGKLEKLRIGIDLEEVLRRDLPEILREVTR